MVSQTDSLGLHRAYKYDELGNVIQETVTFLGVSDPSHVPVVDANGDPVDQLVTTYTYDPLFSKMTSKTDAEDNTTFYVYDSPTGVPTDIPDGVSYPVPSGKTGNLLAVINAEGETTEFTYDTNGDLLARTDPRGHVTEYLAYDPYGNATLFVDPEGNETTRTFDVRSRLLTQIDTFGHHVEYEYDALDRKIRETLFDKVYNETAGSGVAWAQQTLYEYRDGGELKSMTDGLGQVTTYEYDSGNRLVTVREMDVVAADGTAMDLTSHSKYDESGNVIWQKDLRGIERYFSFDELNRNFLIELTVSGTPETWQYRYDTENNLIEHTDNFNNTTQYVYDQLHRPVKTILPFTGAVIDTRYDRVGNKVLETDANGNPMTYTYDKVYRVTKDTDALDNSVEYTYDLSGNVVKEQHRSGSQLTYEVTYDDGVQIQDGLGRPTIVQQKVFLGDPTVLTTPEVVYTTTVEYHDDQNRTVITDPRLIKIEERLDGLDRIHRFTQDLEGLNLATQYSYDGNSNVLTVMDAQGGDIDVRYTYDGLNRMILAEYPLGFFERYVYDGNGNVLEHTDRRGTVPQAECVIYKCVDFQTEYDELNRPIEKMVRENISRGGLWLTTMTYSYDDANRKVTTTDANGNPTIHQYDELGRVKTITDALGEMDHFTYDGVNMRTSIDRLGRRTEYDYDAINRLVHVREYDDAGTFQTEMITTYEDAAQTITGTDRRGIKTITQNDSVGRQVRLTRMHPDLEAFYGTAEVVLQETEYDGNNNVTLVRDAQGNQTKYDYDGDNRPIEIIAGFGSPVHASTRSTYDDVGNLLTVKDARETGATADMTYTYDALYRQITATNGEGETTRYTYDGNNNLLSMTEPKGAANTAYTTSYTYDEFNKLLSVDETRGGVGGVTRYLYDANRNRVAQQDANGNLVTYEYDALNRVIDIFQHFVPGQITDITQRGTSPGGNVATALHTHFAYDDVGNQTLIVDPMGQRVDLTYDYLDRLETRAYSNHVNPNLDYQPQSIVYGYDDNSNLASVTEVKQVQGANVTESYAYEYDQLDRLVQATNYDSKTIAYTYDRQGNRLSVTDPDAITTNYTYDERNRLKTATTEAGTTIYTYFPDSLIQSIAYPNGMVKDYPSYDRADRLLNIVNYVGTSDQPPSPEQVVSSYQYSYDANGEPDQPGGDATRHQRRCARADDVRV